MNSRYTIINFIVIAICFLTSLSAQSESVMLSDSLSLDNTIRYGRLPNGFTYYIKTLTEPQSKLYLKFIVKAGSNQEDTDQLDISHAIEHLAFRSSKNFPLGLPNDKEIVNKLRMNGFDDFGAGNSSYYTQYTFDAPLNNIYALKTGLLWFKDIAAGLSLTEVDIDKERGALRQEFILRNGTNLGQYLTKQRLYSKIFPCSLDPSNFFEYNRTFQPEILRRYYKDWYRPDLMALSIVGNIENLDALEERIKDTFGDIIPNGNPRNWKNCDSLYYVQPPQFVVEPRTIDSLKSVTDEKVEFLLAFRDLETSKKIHTMEGVERVLVWNMLMEVLRRRLKVLENIYNADFMSSGVYSYPATTGNPLAFNVFITSHNGKEKEALKETMILLNQFKKYGLELEEWNEIKKKWINQLAYSRITNAGYWHEEILNNFIFDEALPNDKRTLLKQFLNNLSLKECNNRLINLFSDMPEDIGLIVPSGHRALLYTEKEVRSWIKEAFGSPVEPYVMETVPYSLISTDELSLLKERKYIDKGNEKFGARKFVLDNGVKIVLKSYKPSPGLNMDKIMLHGFSDKGANCFPEEDYFSAINAPDFIKNSGVGNLDKFELNNLLLHTSLWQGVFPYINFNETGIKGAASEKELETMLQLVYLYFTKPRLDNEAFVDWQRSRYYEYQNPTYGLVSTDFDNAVKEIVGDSALLFPLGTKHFKGSQIADLEKGHKIYKELFSNARDFTFLISGDFAIDSVLPIIQKYLGNLPSLDDAYQCNSNAKSETLLDQGPVFKRIPIPDYGMKNVNYGIKYFNNPYTPFNWQENIKIQLLGAIINDKVWELRHEKGYALYYINVYGGFNHDLQRYQISLKIDCEIDEFASIHKECGQIISDIRSGRISDELFQLNINRMRSLYSVNRINGNDQVQRRLYEYYRYHTAWLDSMELEKFIESMNIKDIVEMANLLFNDKNRYEFVMGNQ